MVVVVVVVAVAVAWVGGHDVTLIYLREREKFSEAKIKLIRHIFKVLDLGFGRLR